MNKCAVIALKFLRVSLVACSLAGPLEAGMPSDLVSRAEQLIRSGNKKEALTALSTASQSAPCSAQTEDRIGFLFAVLALQNDAIEHFQKSIALDAGYPMAHYHLGVALWLKGDRDGSIPELQEAVKLAPRVFDYHYRLGSAYVESERNSEALVELKEAVALDSSSPQAWDSLGHAMQHVGDLAGAVDAYHHGVTLDPTDDGLRSDYASMLIETRQPDQAIREFEKILQHNPSNSTILVKMGYAHLKKGEFGLAVKAFTDALEKDPSSAAAHYDLGVARKQMDDLESAKKEFNEAIRLDPSLPEARYILGITEWQLGNFVEAAAQMRAAIAIRPDYAEAHYMLGTILKQSGDPDAAISELKEAIRLDPSTPGPYNALGQILRTKGDKKGSEELFSTAARLKSEKEARLSNMLEQGIQ
jgi:tetratricopeptide (TPR) repeat protein